MWHAMQEWKKQESKTQPPDRTFVEILRPPARYIYYFFLHSFVLLKIADCFPFRNIRRCLTRHFG